MLYLPRKICKDKRTKDKKYRKVRDHCHYTGEYRGAAHSIGNLKYSEPKEISIAFYNGTNHDYHFIMKELAEEFQKEITCSGENAVKPLTFSVPMQKEVTRIDKNGEEIRKIISYRIQFTHSTRFMARSLSNLCKNLAEGIRKIKCKYEHNNKKCEIWGIKYKDCDSFLEYTNFKNDLIEYKCLYCNKNYQKKNYENLKKWFFNTYKQSNHDINKFILLLQKGVYPYEYMNDWEKINEKSLPHKEDFCIDLNMEDITDADYTHTEIV